MQWISEVKQAKHVRKLSMVTCYDATFAKIINQSKIDMILVGDSVAMTVYGQASTIYATDEMILRHTEAVRRGAPDKFIIADMPFTSVRQGSHHAFRVATDYIRAGANAVKVEGFGHYAEIIDYLIKSGIPVMGHLGLTPQIVHQIGGYKVQGREIPAAQQLLADAKALETLGVFALVLECVPSTLAHETTASIAIPTIGIGAGQSVDGQVLVLQDLLGMDPSFKAKFVKQYVTLSNLIESALNDYAFEVIGQHFPTKEHSYD